MKIYRKIVMYCVKEIADDLSEEALEEAIGEFEEAAAQCADDCKVGDNRSRTAVFRSEVMGSSMEEMRENCA